MLFRSEVEMADRMCGGHKQISQMLRNIYDRQRAGALRATADGITWMEYLWYEDSGLTEDDESVHALIE